MPPAGRQPEPEKWDERAAQLEYLMRRFGDQVLRWAYYHVRDRHLAEDIAQEVFLRAYRGLDDFRQESSYQTWLYRITANRCRDYLRSAAFRRLIPWGDTREMEGPGGETERLLEEVEGGEVFRRVLDLPLPYRLVVALHYWQGLPVQEVARLTGLSEGNVRTRLSRARAMLKESLAGEGR